MEKTYNVSEAAEKIGVSVKTLQRWDRDGKLVANRTPSNRRYYTEIQLNEIFDMEVKKMREKFNELAKRFIEYLKDREFDEPFKFEMNDGCCEDNFMFGTEFVGSFDAWIFVTAMYGDGSVTTASMFTLADNDFNGNWDDYLDVIADYYYNNYKYWTPVVQK